MAHYAKASESRAQKEEKHEAEEFFVALKKTNGFELKRITDVQKNRYDCVYQLIGRLILNERNQSRPNMVIQNCRSGEYMYNVLITAGIADIEPLPGVVLCTWSTGASVIGMARFFYSTEESKKYNLVHPEFFRRSFCRKLDEGDDDINTVIVALNIRGNPWGLIVGGRKPNSSRNIEKRTVFFGDSLGWKCPKHLVSLFKAVVDHFFPKTKVE